LRAISFILFGNYPVNKNTFNYGGNDNLLPMKKYIGCALLVILLVTLSGCTQQVQPAPETPGPTPEPTPVPTAEPTPEPTPELTTIVTTVPATTAATMAPQIKITTIYIRNNTFVPAQLTVYPGTGITWVNDDHVIHVVKSAGASAGKFTSGEIIYGGSFGYTFGDKEGSYEFTDPNYPEMTGTIVVMRGQSIAGAPPQQTTAIQA
jgi:plastocyanin